MKLAIPQLTIVTWDAWCGGARGAERLVASAGECVREANDCMSEDVLILFYEAVRADRGRLSSRHQRRVTDLSWLARSTEAVFSFFCKNFFAKESY